MKKFNTMAELAGHLGLSRSTVSYILNDKWRERDISEKTAKRVLDFAREVNFSPNFLGLAIKGKIHTDVAILLPHHTMEHHQQAFFDFLQIIEENQLNYLVLQLGDTPDNHAAIHRLRDFRVRRAIVFTAPLQGASDFFDFWPRAARETPEVDWLFYDYRYELEKQPVAWSPNVRTTGFDAHQARRRIMAYIAAAGYRKVWRLGTEDNPWNLPELYREFNLEPGQLPPTVEFGSDNLIEYGREIGRSLLRLPARSSRPEAVFISDDIATIGAVSELLDHGRRVPEDYAFISWDGLKISSYFRRTVTTLVIPHREMLDYARRFVLDDHCPPQLIGTPFVRPGETMPPPPAASDAD